MTDTLQDRIKLEPQWKEALKDQFELPYMQTLKQFLFQEKSSGKIIFPPGDDIFSAFNLTPLDHVKVVIIGQDPYHGPNQAHGLCFSVKKGIPAPPSLVNIYKELESDMGIQPPQHGFLEAWAKQGILMLNAVLTVESGKAGSHQNRGWETFTDRVIEILNQRKENIVFILWGAYAKKKGEKIDRKKHMVLYAPHPSPLSSYRGFFGSKPFSKTNDYLRSKEIAEINWSIHN